MERCICGNPATHRACAPANQPYNGWAGYRLLWAETSSPSVVEAMSPPMTETKNYTMSIPHCGDPECGRKALECIYPDLRDNRTASP